MPIFSHQFSGLFLNKRKPKPEPLVIRDALGTFTLSHPGKDDKYAGAINLLGKEVSVYLETDGNGKMTANAALQHFHTFAPNAADWDVRVKKSAAEEFADQDGTIETWGGCDKDSEGEILSKEEFMRRISMNFICFYSDGSIFLDYDLDDMYPDHGLGVNADISGNIDSCALWG